MTLKEIPFPKLTCKEVLSTLCASHLVTAKKISNTLLLSTEKRKLVTDSRKLGGGDLFLAYKGAHSDGHNFIEKALKNKPVLFIVEDKSKLPSDDDISFIEVSCGREAWAYLCAKAYSHPEKNLQLIGITGTNGKTSSLFLLKSMFKVCGLKYLAMGTLGIELNGKLYESSHTTPDPPLLYYWLSEAQKSGVRYVMMEVSSHSVTQKKLAGLHFSAAGFTSFSRDHLDFHNSMKDYFIAKLSFLKYLTDKRATVAISKTILENHLAESLLDELKDKNTIIYGFKNSHKHPSRSTKTLDLSIKEKGTGTAELTLEGEIKARGSVRFIEDYRIENFALSLLLFTKLTGRSFDHHLWGSIEQVPGRMERVESERGLPEVYVDYSHTPDALEKCLDQIRKNSSFKSGDQKLWLIFGCGGDRDKGKRPLMAKIAENYADKIIVTSDNPRGEDPLKIIDEILMGFGVKKSPLTIPDRKEAINYAIKNAADSDLVLIAGKGHETYQIIGEKTHFFDDRQEARRALSERKIDD